MPPLISLVTPSYNQGHLIAQTIESVLGQRYPHLEYWIIDGGSSDDTLAVIHRYASDPRLRWISEPDRGLGHALNKGLEHCQGDVLGWLNSDDSLLGQPLEEAAEYWAAHPATAVLYRQVQFTDSAGLPLPLAPLGSPFDWVETLSGVVSIGQPGTLFTRTLWEQLGPLREDLGYTLDIDYWLRAYPNGELHFLPGIRATYRQHRGSKTSANQVATWQERQRLAQEYAQNPTFWPYQHGQERRIQANIALGLAQAYAAEGDSASARQQIRRALRQAPWGRRRAYIALLALDYHWGSRWATRAAQIWQSLKR